MYFYFACENTYRENMELSWFTTGRNSYARFLRGPFA